MADACTPEELGEAQEFLQRLANDERPVSKLTDLINAAVPSRRITAGLQSAERSKRARDVARILPQGEGEQAFINAKAALSGRLPKADFTAVRGQLTDDDVTELFNIIRDAPNTSPFDKVVVSDALAKLLDEAGGEVPTLGEIRRLRKMFGNPLANAVNDKAKIGLRLGENAVSLLNLPRSILTAFDLSAPFRQGALLIGHPIEFVGNMKPMMKAFASEEFAQKRMQELKSRPFFQRGDSAGLFIAEIDDVGDLAAREEAYMSTLADRIPGLRNSSRSYGVYLNGLRADVFDRTVRGWDMTNGGRGTQDLLDDAARARPDNPSQADDLESRAAAQLNDEAELADMLNKFSGRGDIGPLNQYAPILNNVMFSSRLLASRVQAPLKIFSSSSRVRKIAAKDLMVFVGTGLSLLSMAKLAGADVELDPRSSNFGKIRVGQTRLDIWAGFQPLARYAAQAIRGESKTQLGEIVDQDRWNVAWRFIQSKASPQAGLGIDLIRGEDFLGRDVFPKDIGFNIPDADNPSPFTGKLPGSIANRLVPLFLQDLYDAAKEGSVASVLLTIPAAFGASAQTFTSQSEEIAALIAEDLETGKLTGAYDLAQPIRIGDLTNEDTPIFEELHPGLTERLEEGKAPASETGYFGAIETASTSYEATLDGIQNDIQSGVFGELGSQEMLSAVWDAYQDNGVGRARSMSDAADQFPETIAELRDRPPKSQEARILNEYFALQEKHSNRRTEEEWAAYEAEFQGAFSAADQSTIERELSIEDHELEKAYHGLNKTINETAGQSYYDIPTDALAFGGSAREQWRRQHPEVDAALIMLGRVSRPVSPKAANIVEQQSRQVFGQSFRPTTALSGLQPIGRIGNLR